jgi:hypothetical protein
VGSKERFFDSLRSLRISILVGCEGRSFVARRSGLLRTDSLVGNLVNNKTPHPPSFFIGVDST